MLLNGLQVTWRRKGTGFINKGEGSRALIAPAFLLLGGSWGCFRAVLIPRLATHQNPMGRVLQQINRKKKREREREREEGPEDWTCRSKDTETNFIMWTLFRLQFKQIVKSKKNDIYETIGNVTTDWKSNDVKELFLIFNIFRCDGGV